MTQRGQSRPLQELEEKTSPAAKKGPAGGHAPHVQLGAESDPTEQRRLGVGGREVLPKKTEMLFPEETGTRAGVGQSDRWSSQTLSSAGSRN